MTRNWIAALVLLVGACSGASDTAEETTTPVALVKLAAVSAGGSAQQITVYGAAEPEPNGKMALVAPAEARVAAIEAPVGSRVAQGQVIAHLTASPATRADAAKAASDAAAANAALARAQRLRADGLGSDAEVETARAAATAANALQASFSTRTNGLILRAPVAGTVDTVSVQVGDMLQPGAAVASVTRDGAMRARFGVDPDTARQVRPGMGLRIAGLSSRAPVTVKVESVSPVVDAQTKLASIFAHIPAGSEVASGETLSGTISLAAHGGAQSVPYGALLDDAGQAYVYVVAGDVAHRRDVETGSSSGSLITVTKGLKAGEQVVIEGGTAVEDGMKVRTR